MPQEIYNEGRVVGFSAWEIFKRQALGNGVSENDIPNEREWLASMVGSGASMILRIPSGTQAGINDFELPSGSSLSAAGTIIANPFIGTCEYDESIGAANWAKKVTSYGPLILNNQEHYPNPQHTEGVPEIPGDTDYSSYINSINEFSKITDGIVYTKNANWLSCGYSEEDFIGDGEQTTFPLDYPVISVTTLTIDDIEVPDTDYSIDTSVTPNELVFNSAPATGSKINIRYSAHSNPEKDIDPNFGSSSTVVRLYISRNIISDVYVIFTGFINKRILQTISGYAVEGEDHSIGGSADIEHNNWPNGGMLGPEIIPWSTKIIFSIPSFAYDLANSITRKIPSDETITDGTKYGYTFAKTNATVKSKSSIDLNSISLTDYYNDTDHSFEVDPTLQESVSNLSLGTNDQLNVLTAWYPGLTGEEINGLVDNSKFFPPALYATQVKQNGPQTMVPLDTAAPGTVKGFSNATQATNYKALLPDNFAVYYNPQTDAFSFVVDGLQEAEWPGSAKITYNVAPKATITAGSKSVSFIALTRPDGTEYNTAGSSQETIVIGPRDNLTWTNLLTSLTQNKSMDILGSRLRLLGTELSVPNAQTIGVIRGNNDIKNIASDKFTIKGDDPVELFTSRNQSDLSTHLATLDSGSAYKSGTNFIEFGNGLRLYISDSAPDLTNVPEGSIGIGWVESSTDPGELIDEHSTPALGGEG